LVCALDLQECVVCVGDEDCGDEEFCGADHVCHEPIACESDIDCKVHELVCDKEAGLCVECLADNDCADEEYCKESFCFADECVAGEAYCDENVVTACLEDGSGWTTAEVCGEGQYCEEIECLDFVCEPDTIWCDGEVYKVCAENGKSVKYEEDCAAKGQHCFNGACIDTKCEPDSVFCEDDFTAAVCSADGMDSTPTLCAGEHYCEDGSCFPWMCAPAVAYCENDVAKLCDAKGSSVVNEVNCAAAGKLCAGGQCVDCQPQCDGKECGDNGCGGECGSCDDLDACTDDSCGAGICEHAQIPDCCTSDETCDDDGDGIPNSEDNCVDVENPLQEDLDNDDLGDACDPDKDGDGFEAEVDDCDDLNAEVHPGQVEVLDGIDNNCDGFADEGFSALSCKTVLFANPLTQSGVYPIDPDGVAGPTLPKNLYCDMETAGGGWTVVFSSDDPAKWKTDFGSPGEGQWGHYLSGFPVPMTEVLLLRVATGETKIVSGIAHSALYSCSKGDDATFWDGSLWHNWNAYHLGVCNTISVNGQTGYIITCASCNGNRQSWGFGHRGWLDDQQGWGWHSLQLGPTVFTIAVR